MAKVDSRKIGVFAAVLFVGVVLAMAGPAFAEVVNATASVTNVLPYQPVKNGVNINNTFVHSTTPSIALYRGIDNNGDTVNTTVNVTTNSANWCALTGQDWVGTSGTAFAAQNSSFTMTIGSGTPLVPTFTYSASGGANNTKSYYFCMYSNDSSGAAQTFNMTFPLALNLTIYNSQPTAPSALNVSETIIYHGNDATVSWTYGSDPDTDALTHRMFVGTSAGAGNVLANTTVTTPYSLTSADMYGPGENSNNTTASRTRYYVRIYENDGTSLTAGSGNANSTVYVTTFNITNARPTVTTAWVNSTTAAPTTEGQYVRFNVTWADAEDDTASPSIMRICSTASATPTGCTATTLCSSVNAPPVANATCNYLTGAGDAADNSVYAFVWDRYGLPTDNSAAVNIHYYVDHGITFTNYTFGKQTLADVYVGGVFEVGDKVNCSAVIKSPDNAVTDVRFILYGPNGSITSYDNTSANVSGSCVGAAWSTGKNCSANFLIDTSGTTDAGPCRNSEGTWQCIVNATNQFAQNKTSGAPVAQLQQVLTNSQPVVTAGISASDGSDTITLVWTGPGTAAAVKKLNMTYRDKNGYDDVNTASCGSNGCQVHCWQGNGADTNTSTGVSDAWWNFTVRNYTAATADNLGAFSGCSGGGNGTRVLSLNPAFESETMNGTWSCIMRVNDNNNSYAWTAIKNNFNVNELLAADDYDSSSVYHDYITYAFSGSPGATYQSTYSGGNYVEYRHKGNSCQYVRYLGNNFTKGTDGSTLILVGNFSVNLSTSAFPDCTSNGCRPLNNTYRFLGGSPLMCQDAIANYPNDLRHYSSAGLAIPVGTPMGNYNTSFVDGKCLRSGALCTDGGS